MADLDNPYVSPAADEPNPSGHDINVDPRTIGKARLVPTVAILMIVHGVLMFLAGCCLIGMIAFVTPQIAQQIELQQKMQRQQNPNTPQLDQGTTAKVLTAVYGAMAAGLFVVGAVNVIAGLLNYQYRQRVFGVISLVLSMGSILFCWCVPLSIGLLIFGMIIYLSPEADQAFRWRATNPIKS